MPSAEGVIAAITQPETWPDYATEIGRFTPLRAGGLAGQTFEIEVAANTRTALPVFTRGYVTITSLVTPDDPKALHDWFEALEAGMEKYGNARIVPEGGEPLVGFDLTTHQRALHGLRPQPARALHARRPGLPARRGHVGPDAVAPRQGLQGGRAAKPSTRSGAPARTRR